MKRPKCGSLTLRFSAAQCERAACYIIAAAKWEKKRAAKDPTSDPADISDEFVETIRLAGLRRRSEADGSIKDRESYKGHSFTFGLGPRLRGGFHDGPEWRTRRRWTADDARALRTAIEWTVEKAIYLQPGLEPALKARLARLNEWLNRSLVDRLAALDTR